MTTATTQTGEHQAPEVVDFHSHWFPPAVVREQPADGLTPALRRAWPLLTDLPAQLELLAADGGPTTRVLSAPLSSIAAMVDVPADELPKRVNEQLAWAVAEHAGVRALASVNAFAGDAAVDVAEHAIDELGLDGLLLDCAQHELLLNAPEARPTLVFAAERGIPVFAHPVNPPSLAARFADAGGPGILLARGCESALSTLALLRDGVFKELAGLRVAIAGIGAAALLLAGFLDEEGSGGAVLEGIELHVDVMGLDPVFVRAIVDILGTDRVLVGSDWPIMPRAATVARVGSTLARAGLDGPGIEAVAAGNARRLLTPGQAQKPLQQATFDNL